MPRRALFIGALVVSGLLAGCTEPTPGTTRLLGAVDYDKAFAASRGVVTQYFSVESAESESGLIRSRPQPIERGEGGLLGLSPGQNQRTATLRLRREGPEVIARLSIAVQVLEGSQRRVQPADENYDSVPNKGPAQMEGATTPEQNEVWRTWRYDHALEARMLDDIHKALRPPPTQKQAATAPKP